MGLMSVSELKEEIIALGGNAEGCFERGEVEEKLLQARVGGSVRWAREDRQGGEEALDLAFADFVLGVYDPNVKVPPAGPP